MYDSSLFEQFITDIKFTNLGQTVIIYCCPSGSFENNNSVYQFMCLRCEKVQLNLYQTRKDYIHRYGCIDLVEFSVTKQKDDKTSVYIWGRSFARCYLRRH